MSAIKNNPANYQRREICAPAREPLDMNAPLHPCWTSAVVGEDGWVRFPRNNPPARIMIDETDTYDPPGTPPRAHTVCGLCDRALVDAGSCQGSCPYRPMTMPQRLAHRVSSIRIMEQVAADRARRELEAIDTLVAARILDFEAAYERAVQSSQPDDWAEAALLGKQLATAVREAS